MAISKEVWAKMEKLAAKLGVAEMALKYERYGFPYKYHTRKDILLRITDLRIKIDSVFTNAVRQKTKQL